MSRSEIWRATLIRYAPIILWVGVIFFLSSENGSMDQTSRIIGPILHFLFPSAPDETIKLYHSFIRKAAHFTEYAILAVLTARALTSSPASPLKRSWFVWAILLACLVAATDEFNQSLEISRTGSYYDVLLDMSGAITGVILVYLFRRSSPAGNAEAT